jgi:ubiquinone/menaquinone biosynthesis C-methylase UbiE
MFALRKNGLLSRTNYSLAHTSVHAAAHARAVSRPRRIESAATEIIGLDPSPKLLEVANKAAQKTPIPLRLLEGTAEAIPIEDHNVDPVVTTWTVCSIAEIQSALQEMRRVLRPGGRLLFVEYGRAADSRVRWWQDHLTPAWRRLSGGCHLNRAIDELARECRFSHRAARSRIYARAQTDDVHV